MEKTCQRCHEGFTGTADGPGCCSTRCAHERRLEATCGLCGQPFCEHSLVLPEEPTPDAWPVVAAGLRWAAIAALAFWVLVGLGHRLGLVKVWIQDCEHGSHTFLIPAACVPPDHRTK